MQTIVTYNGTRYDPMPHATRVDAMVYVTEFLDFHGTEAGAICRQLAEDAWCIRRGPDFLTISIEADS